MSGPALLVDQLQPRGQGSERPNGPPRIPASAKRSNTAHSVSCAAATTPDVSAFYSTARRAERRPKPVPAFTWMRSSRSRLVRRSERTSNERAVPVSSDACIGLAKEASLHSWFVIPSLVA